MIRPIVLFAIAAGVAAGVAHADVPQAFTATIGDIAFESGDDEITLVPISGKFSLSASTKGAATWPPPKTRVDRLAIVCDGFEDGKPLLRDHTDFERSTCDVTFEQGTRSMGGSADAEYTLDKSSPDNRFEIAVAEGKVYKGSFTFRLKDKSGKTIVVSNGRFTAEDRQL